MKTYANRLQTHVEMLSVPRNIIVTALEERETNGLLVVRGIDGFFRCQNLDASLEKP